MTSSEQVRLSFERRAKQLGITTATIAGQTDYYSALEKFRNSPEFWIWDEQQHKKLFYEKSTDNGKTSTCCFNHTLGLPVK